MRKPNVGCTCKIWGEGNDVRFKVEEVHDTGFAEPIEKCYSIRYAPRLPSYYKDKLNHDKD